MTFHKDLQLGKSLSSNGVIPKQSTDYNAAVIIICLTSGFAVLALSVSNPPLVIDIFDTVCAVLHERPS